MTRPRPLRQLPVFLAALGLVAAGGGASSQGSANSTQTPSHAVKPATSAPSPPPSFDTAPVPKADPGSRLPANWALGGVLQVYVRGYQDSNGDGIGDLRGLISRLDYIKALGVAGIWLLPITASQDRDHGYAVANYRAVEPDYGNLADVDELLRQAHARGLGVIVDHVPNHSAAEHPAFLNARSGVHSPFRDWYLWSTEKPKEKWRIFDADPWRQDASGHYFYAPFSKTMPDFNLRNPAVVNWQFDHLRFWLNRGVDGIRFDAGGMLIENGPNAWDNQPESRALMHQFSQVVASYSNRYVVCEAPGAPLAYAAADACGSAFAFGHQGDLIAAAKGDAAALARVAAFPALAPNGQASVARFLSNHDGFAGKRLWDQLGGEQAPYRLAAAMLLLWPGVPFIYYGEEIGMAGGPPSVGHDDHRLRTPMSWTGQASTAGFTSGTPFRGLSANVASHNTQAQLADADSLLHHYRTLLGLRSSRPSLQAGSFEVLAQQGPVLVVRRSHGAEQTLIALNVGTSQASLALPRLAAHALYRPLRAADGGALATDAAGSATLSLPPQSLRLFASP